VRVAGRGLALILAILLARVLGVEQYGVYVFAFAAATLLTVPAVMGLDRLLVRHVALYEARRHPALMRGLLRRADQALVALSLTLVILAAAIGAFVVTEDYRSAFLLALLLIPLRGVTELRQAVLQGLRHPELSQVPLFIAFPVLLAAALLALDLAGVSLDAVDGIALAIGATGGALVLAVLLRRVFMAASGALVGPEFETRAWFRAALPFGAVAMLSAGLNQAGIIGVGLLEEPTDVAVFQAALRITELLTLVILAVHTYLAPFVARMHDANEMEALNGLVRQWARLGLLFSLPLAAVMLAAQSSLFLVFGEGFTGGQTALTILVAGQLVYAAMGPVGIVLLMTGYASTAARGFAVGLGVELILIVALVPPLGIDGAAIAHSVAMVCWNVLLAVATVRLLNVNPTALPLPRAIGGSGRE
jgi:O-antigen/teichoic acid export membrane protein